jgi:hypothetical protein
LNTQCGKRRVFLSNIVRNTDIQMQKNEKEFVLNPTLKKTENAFKV